MSSVTLFAGSEPGDPTAAAKFLTRRNQLT
jgi:hypothetical protein